MLKIYSIISLVWPHCKGPCMYVVFAWLRNYNHLYVGNAMMCPLLVFHEILLGFEVVALLFCLDRNGVNTSESMCKIPGIV